ncbi:GNAT family N-acetyltransferase [Kitasatospora sp. NPDC052868]|uniref:GNAT family N-acetyltransferase n=1 Tax=Kitasatospora sp. NPDC052868 TaxID=3364060 RepID=UPI0037C82CCE
MDDDIRIRPLAEGDWDAVVALEAGAYAADGLSEGREALESRGRSSPGTCFVAEHRGRVGGYLLALPYPPMRIPDLSLPEGPGPARAATGGGPAAGNLHAHDLVIAEELRGRGLGVRLLDHLLETAREQRFERISLVAVRGTEVLWAPLGYRAHPGVGIPASYGSRAVYMSMAVAAPDEKSNHTGDPLQPAAPTDELG